MAPLLPSGGVQTPAGMAGMGWPLPREAKSEGQCPPWTRVSLLRLYMEQFGASEEGGPDTCPGSALSKP